MTNSPEGDKEPPTLGRQKEAPRHGAQGLAAGFAAPVALVGHGAQGAHEAQRRDAAVEVAPAVAVHEPPATRASSQRVGPAPGTHSSGVARAWD